MRNYGNEINIIKNRIIMLAKEIDSSDVVKIELEKVINEYNNKITSFSSTDVSLSLDSDYSTFTNFYYELEKFYKFLENTNKRFQINKDLLNLINLVIESDNIKENEISTRLNEINDNALLEKILSLKIIARNNPDIFNDFISKYKAIFDLNIVGIKEMIREVIANLGNEKIPEVNEESETYFSFIKELDNVIRQYNVSSDFLCYKYIKDFYIYSDEAKDSEINKLYEYIEELISLLNFELKRMTINDENISSIRYLHRLKQEKDDLNKPYEDKKADLSKLISDIKKSIDHVKNINDRIEISPFAFGYLGPVASNIDFNHSSIHNLEIVESYQLKDEDFGELLYETGKLTDFAFKYTSSYDLNRASSLFIDNEPSFINYLRSLHKNPTRDNYGPRSWLGVSDNRKDDKDSLGSFSEYVQGLRFIIKSKDCFRFLEGIESREYIKGFDWFKYGEFPQDRLDFSKLGMTYSEVKKNLDKYKTSKVISVYSRKPYKGKEIVKDKFDKFYYEIYSPARIKVDELYTEEIVEKQSNVYEINGYRFIIIDDTAYEVAPIEWMMKDGKLYSLNSLLSPSYVDLLTKKHVSLRDYFIKTIMTPSMLIANHPSIKSIFDEFYKISMCYSGDVLEYMLEIKKEVGEILFDDFQKGNIDKYSFEAETKINECIGKLNAILYRTKIFFNTRNNYFDFKQIIEGKKDGNYLSDVVNRIKELFEKNIVAASLQKEFYEMISNYSIEIDQRYEKFEKDYDFLNSQLEEITLDSLEFEFNNKLQKFLDKLSNFIDPNSNYKDFINFSIKSSKNFAADTISEVCQRFILALLSNTLTHEEIELVLKSKEILDQSYNLDDYDARYFTCVKIETELAKIDSDIELREKFEDSTKRFIVDTNTEKMIDFDSINSDIIYQYAENIIKKDAKNQYRNRLLSILNIVDEIKNEPFFTFVAPEKGRKVLLSIYTNLNQIDKQLDGDFGDKKPGINKVV